MPPISDKKPASKTLLDEIIAKQKPAPGSVAEICDLVIEVRERLYAAGYKNRDPLYASPPSREVEPLTPESWEEIEAVIACLGDDAAQLREENAEDERAANMDRAADLLAFAYGIHSRGEGEKA